MTNDVFLPSDDLDSSTMISYLQALLRACPSLKFTLVRPDEKLGGFKIRFSAPEDSWNTVPVSVGDESIPIYPLTTTLLFKGKNNADKEIFRRELTKIINDKLKVRVVDSDYIGKKYGYEKWIFEINLPESEAYIKDIVLQLTSSLPERDLTVEIWCRKCNEEGHSFRECGNTSNSTAEHPSTSDALRRNAVIKDEVSTGSDDQSESNTKLTTSKTGKYPAIDFETTNSIAQKIGEDLVRKSQEQNSSSIPDPNKNKSAHDDYFSEEDDCDPSESNRFLKQEEVDSTFQRAVSTSNIIYSENSNDDDDIMEYEKNSGVSRDSNFSKPDDFMLSEASWSPTAFRDGESSSSAAARPAKKRAKPTSRVEDINQLSEQLISCLDEAYKVVPVLKRAELAMFFSHVKKKGNALRIAMNFTQDTKMLKKQLQAILDQYYSTPQTGAVKDIQFIKWLRGLVDRFDGVIPRKRTSTKKKQ